MILNAKASLQILKPIDTVFEAIVKQEHMTNYFISESSGDLENGNDTVWKFPEFEQKFAITKVKIEKDKSISFVWDPETIVEIELIEFNKSSTIVKVKEGGKTLNDENLKWLVNNTGGWANFLASLKAYTEHGINLRKGAYEYMRKK